MNDELKKKIEQTAIDIIEANGLPSAKRHVRALIHKGADLALQWISVEELPELPTNERGIRSSPAILAFDGKCRKIAHYFPDKFMQVEWEDWDDYKQEDYPWTTEDADRGVVWLNEGFYYLKSHDDYECWEPFAASHWMPLPTPPSHD